MSAVARAPVEIPDAELILRAIRTARQPDGRKGPRWIAVRHVFTCGSTVARQLCQRFELDPNEEIR